MGSTVGTRPNHYELLGLEPTASREEIDEAFALAMRRPHLMTEVAEIGIAFDTLRSASKRRAYDEALGLRREPEPPPSPQPAMSFRVSARLAAIASAEPLAPPSVVPTAPRVQPPRPEPIPDPRPDPAPRLEPLADLWRLPPEAEFGPRIAPRPRSRRLDAEERPTDWKYPLLAFGSVLLGVVVVAAWAGAHAQDHASPETVAAAPLKHHAAAPAPVQADLKPLPEAAPSAPPPAGRIRHRPAMRERISGERLAGIDETLASPPQEQAPGDAPATDVPAPPPAVSASLPLPNAVVARTIDRIGYRCGSVASAAAAGAPGAYKVTCTSGQSFEAKPVRGRYRFRRL